MSSDEGVTIQSKRGKGRPAPGELKAGEIGINISTVADDVDIHGRWDSYIIDTPRAYTADEEGKLHAIGDWESLKPSPVYGDLPYQDVYNGRMLPAFQHAMMKYKDFVAFGGEFAGLSFPIPNGGGPSDIDFEKYFQNFASIKFQHSQASYNDDELNTLSPPHATLKVGGLYEDKDLERNVGFEIDCLSMKVETKEQSADYNNVPLFVNTHKDGKDLSKNQGGSYPTAQTFINAPMNLLGWWGDDHPENGHYELDDDYFEHPDAALCVYGDSAVLGGTIKATSSRVPTDPEEGMIYFNTETKSFLGFDGTDWGDLLGSSSDTDGDLPEMTSDATPNTLVLRDGSANAKFNLITAKNFTMNQPTVSSNHFDTWFLSGGEQSTHGVKKNDAAGMRGSLSVYSMTEADQRFSEEGHYHAMYSKTDHTHTQYLRNNIDSTTSHKLTSKKGFAVSENTGPNDGNKYFEFGKWNAYERWANGSGDPESRELNFAFGKGYGTQVFSFNTGSQGNDPYFRLHKGHIHFPNVELHSRANQIGKEALVIATSLGEERASIQIDGSARFNKSVAAQSFTDLNGNPKTVSPAELIETLSTLRDATRDETTAEGLRDSIGNAIGGLIEKFEAQIKTVREMYDEQ